LHDYVTLEFFAVARMGGVRSLDPEELRRSSRFDDGGAVHRANELAPPR